VSTIDPATRHDLSDAQWVLLEPLTPPPSRRGRPRRWPIRSLVDGVRHRARVGCPWRDVPRRYGPWWRVYALFACWQVLGVWDRIESALRSRAAAAKRLSWQVSVDSTTARAHIHAAGARRDSVDRVAGEPDHHALGRSRGGWGTKTHVAIDQHRGVLTFQLTPGQANDSPQFIPVLEQIRVARIGPGRPQPGPSASWPTRPTHRAPTETGCAAAGSGPPSRAPPISSGTDNDEDPEAADHQRSTLTGTRTVTPSNAASTSLSSTALSPPATTNSPSATQPPPTSWSSTPGSDDFRNRS
jgi:transposase